MWRQNTMCIKAQMEASHLQISCKQIIMFEILKFIKQTTIKFGCSALRQSTRQQTKGKTLLQKARV